MPKPYKSSLVALAKNLRKISIYLGYGPLGDARRSFLKSKAKALKKDSITALLHFLLKQRFPDWPE